MNSRERFLTVLHAGVPDRTPLFEFYWSLPFIRSVLGSSQTSLYHNADDEVAMSRATGIDMVYTAPTPSTWTSSGRGWKNWIRPRGWLKNNFGISLGEKGVRSLLCEAPGTDRRLVGAAGGKRLLTPFSRGHQLGKLFLSRP